MSTIPYTLKFNRMAQWARQQSLFKLRDTYVAYGVRGLNASAVTIGSFAMFSATNEGQWTTDSFILLIILRQFSFAALTQYVFKRS